MLRLTSSAISIGSVLLAGPVLAQDNTVAAAPQEDGVKQSDEGEGAGGKDRNQILVVATRLRGQVETDQPPVATYDEAEIAALGAGSITELLGRVSPQTGSGRGRGGQPVILVNGQRITNFREMRNFPPEAIRRMEVLPEEVALKYGFAPDARVINFILKDNFRSRSVETKLGLPTSGGFRTSSLEGTLLKIQGPTRLSVTVSTDDTSPLTEAERGVIQASPPAAGSPDPAQYRTLIADSRNFGGNFSWSRGLGKDGKGGQFSLNGNVSRADSRSGSGLDTLLAPLERVNHTTEVSGGAGLNTNFGQWQFSATGDATFGKNETLIDRFSGAGFDTATSDTKRFTSLVTLTGRPLRLPAGQVTATLRTGYNWGHIDSLDTRSNSAANLTRGTLFAGFNIAVPLTSRREAVLGAVGDLSLNFSAGYDYVSDFGGVVDWSAGLTWNPTERLGLQASFIVNEVAPSLSQLGLPLTQTFNVPVYDFTSGQTVLATVIGGGNPDLVKEQQRDLKLSANWQIPGMSNSSLLVEYFRNSSSDVTSGFPLLTPAIEAAYPGRVVRNGSGAITSVDQRPVTLAEQKGSRLRWGLNIGGTIGKPTGDSGMMGMIGGGGRGGRGPGGPRPGAGGGGGRGGGGGGGGGMMGAMFGGQGRWTLGLYHTVQFDSTVLIAPGAALLNLLDGDALSGNGGTPRHSLEFNGGAFHKGFGTFIQGTWSAPTTVRASGAPGTGDLRFGSLAKINVNLFADLGRMSKLTKSVPFFKGARMGVQVENVLGARQNVTDANGAVPLSYQPDYLDPRGRVINLTFRKLF